MNLQWVQPRRPHPQAGRTIGGRVMPRFVFSKIHAADYDAVDIDGTRLVCESHMDLGSIDARLAPGQIKPEHADWHLLIRRSTFGRAEQCTTCVQALQKMLQPPKRVSTGEPKRVSE